MPRPRIPADRRPALRQRSTRMGGIREGPAHARGLLVVLVALAGDEHHVAPIGFGDGTRDGGIALGLGLHRGAGDRAQQDLVQDGARRLVARVVAGHDHRVGALLRDAAHERPLGAVAVAAAAEHAPQAPAALLRHGAQRLQGLLERIGRVGVVHGHQGPVRLVDELHAARHGRELCAQAQRACSSGMPSARRLATTASRLWML